jgi:hypothetical protein
MQLSTGAMALTTMLINSSLATAKFWYLLCWCIVLRWIRCLWCYSECISTPGRLEKYTWPQWPIYIYMIYIVFRFTSKSHNSLFHPYRNHQVVSNFENVGCFYAIERMRGMRVGETMLRRNNWCLGETVLSRNNAWVIKFC